MTLATAALSRGLFLTIAKTAFGGVRFAQAAPSEDAVPAPPAPAPGPATAQEPTAEGKALAEAAAASAGHPLTPADQAEVEKQLSSYPSSNERLRRFPIGNGVAPSNGVTSPITDHQT